MLVDRSRLLTQGAAVLLGAAAMTACSDPDLRTNLRTDGPPEVLSVLVMNDPVDNFIETATFCKLNDNKRPGSVSTFAEGPLQVCVDDLTKGAGYETEDPVTYEKTFTAATVEDALPLLWYTRIEFDRLLDTDVETLEDIIGDDGLPTGDQEGHIRNTLPVTLKCNDVEVPYDGYYSPSGNNVTWPVGPSIVVFPQDYTSIPTGASCTIAVKPDVVKSKDGKGAINPTETVGWKIAPLTLDATDPATPNDPTNPSTVDPSAPIFLTFNAAIDPTSLAANEVKLQQVTDCTGAGAVNRTPTITAAEDDPTSIQIVDSASGDPDLAFVPMKTYLLTFTAGNEVADLAGGTTTIDETENQICFKTSAASKPTR